MMIKQYDMTMKTTYIHPNTAIITLHTKQFLTQGSGGVGSGSTLGNAYNKNDESFSREQRSGWTDDDD